MKISIKAALALAGALFLAVSASAADLTYLSPNGIPMKLHDNGDNTYSWAAYSVNGGSSGTPIFVRQAGSTGTDSSANAPALPNVGANFAASGPYASYILIATVAASATRNNVDIENTSGAQIAIVRDDGTAAGASPPANASVFALAGGAGTGAQGGSWASRTFLGRIQIYAPSSGAQVSVMID